MEIASSVERFGRYANWSGSTVLGRLVLIFCMTNLIYLYLFNHLADTFIQSDLQMRTL